MPHALTWESMSPGLLKVGETRSPEPHRRKSRMREIRSSGSGEGPGWATSRPTLQALFTPRRSGLQPRQSAVERDCGGGWTGVSEWGRGAPQGCPGGTAAGRATWDGWRGGPGVALALQQVGCAIEDCTNESITHREKHGTRP